MAYPISDVTRRVVYTGSAGVGPYSFTFEVLANTDIQVYKNTTLQTLTTNYTVTINANGTGSVTLVVAATGADTITIVGDRAIQRATDFVTGGDLFANTLNDEFDSLVIFAQQVDEKADRGLKAPVTDPTDVNMVLPVKASRASKYLAFDSNGNPVASSGTGTTVVSSVMEPVVSAASLSDARTNLGLASGATTTVASGATTTVGTMATQNASAVAITGGTIDNVNLSNTFGFKNRLINSAMVIDQRNAGASVTITTAEEFITDRWQFAPSASSKLTAQQSTTAPTGFNNSLLLTSSAATSVAAGDYYFLGQKIEGFNFTDCGWGTASAATITLSFWCRSSITGTYGGALVNSAQNRSYPFSYSISAANTWEQKTITVAGDTSGTWIGATNGVGVRLRLGFGIGSTYSGTAGAWAAANYMAPTSSTNWISTSGATFYITGVQLEKGSTATSFDYRPYGTELALCQRYYYKVITESAAAKQLAPNGFVDSTTTAFCWTQFPVEMRISATALEQTGTAANYQVRYTAGSTAICSSVPTFNTGNTWGARSVFTTAAVLTSGQAVGLQTAATAGIYLAWSAEL